MRVTKISQIDEFLEAAHEISQKTWQFVRYRWGIGARDLDVVRSEMHFLAQRGWLRGYLLNAVPCHAPSLSDSSMAKPSIPLLPECTPTGEVIAPEQFSCCLFWRTCSTKTQFSFMTWLAMRSTNILPMKAIKKLLSTSSGGARILSWQAASTARAG